MNQGTSWLIALCVTLSAHGGLLFAGTPDSEAGASLHLEGVPERLCLPRPHNSNLVVTAIIQSAQVRNVWLARNEGAIGRIMLTRVLPNRYQIDLADREVFCLLDKQGGDGQFQVFAELADDSVLASEPIRYMDPSGSSSPIFHVLPDPRAFGLFSHESCWADPDRIERLEMQFLGNAAYPAAEVQIRERRWPFTSSSRKDVLALEVTPELRATWKQHGSLELLFSQDCQENRRYYVIRVSPSRLKLPEESVQITVIQQQAKEVPGSEGFLMLHVRDITSGQTLLSLRRGQGPSLIDQVPVHEGDAVPFRFGDVEYTVTVDKLVNFIHGEDYAVFMISTADSRSSTQPAAPASQTSR